MCAGKTGNVADEKFRLRATLDDRREIFHNEPNLTVHSDGCEPFLARRDDGEHAAAGVSRFGFDRFQHLKASVQCFQINHAKSDQEITASGNEKNKEIFFPIVHIKKT